MNDDTQRLADAERCPNGVAFEHKAGRLPDHCRVCRLLSDAYAAGLAARGDAATEAIERVRDYVGLVARIHETYRHLVMDTPEDRAIHAKHVEVADQVLALVTAALDAAPAPTQGTEPYEEPNQ